MDKNFFIKIINFSQDKNEGINYKDITNGVVLSDTECTILKNQLLNAFLNGICINGSTPNYDSIFVLKDNLEINNKFGYNTIPIKDINNPYYINAISLHDGLVPQKKYDFDHIDKINNNKNDYVKNEEYLEDIYILKYEAIFSSLDYLELKESRKNAKNAQINSIKALKQSERALIISIILALMSAIIGGFSIYVDKKYSKLQLSTPITLSGAQLNNIIDSNNKEINLMLNGLKSNTKTLNDINNFLNKEIKNN